MSAYQHTPHQTAVIPQKRVWHGSHIFRIRRSRQTHLVLWWDPPRRYIYIYIFVLQVPSGTAPSTFTTLLGSCSSTFVDVQGCIYFGDHFLLKGMLLHSFLPKTPFRFIEIRAPQKEVPHRYETTRTPASSSQSDRWLLYRLLLSKKAHLQSQLIFSVHASSFSNYLFT